MAAGSSACVAVGAAARRMPAKTSGKDDEFMCSVLPVGNSCSRLGLKRATARGPACVTTNHNWRPPEITRRYWRWLFQRAAAAGNHGRKIGLIHCAEDTAPSGVARDQYLGIGIVCLVALPCALHCPQCAPGNHWYGT